MKFMLHGATNWKSSNFGDFFYAHQIYHFLKQDQGNKVAFYDPSEFFVKYINCGDIDGMDLKEADILIYIPGGYFGEGHNARFRDTLIQYIRFMPFGLKAVREKKYLLTVGVGAGPNDSGFMTRAIKKICRHSVAITTRDVESQKALQDIGVGDVPEYSDMMLSYDLKKLMKDTAQIRNVENFVGGCKLLLVHYNHSYEALEKFALAVNLFAEKYKDYKIVVSADSILPYENDYFEKFKNLCDIETFHFIYDDPYEMIKLIEISDVILTCKLHIGVVGGMFNKSVVCAAEHPEKTMRFYNLIEESSRCISLYDSDYNHIFETLNVFHKLELRIPEREMNKAKKHWSMLQKVINEYEE